MSLPWVELANQCDKRMESTHIGHFFYISAKKLALRDIQFQYLYVFAKIATDLSLIISIQFCPKASFPQGLSWLE